MVALRRRASRLLEAVRPVLESFRSLRSRRRRLLPASSHSAMEPLEQRQLLSSPSLWFQEPEAIHEGESISISGHIQSDGADRIKSWTIDWGDGNTTHAAAVNAHETQLLQSHAYADDGSYAITILATDEADDTSSTTLTALVQRVAPQIQIEGPTAVNRETLANWSFSFSHPTDSVSDWVVRWGDWQSEGDFGSLSTISASHAYDGFYDRMVIWAEAVDDDGQYHYATLSVCITNEAPCVCISGSLYTYEGSTYTLTLSAYDPEGSGVDGTVYWGDGSSTSFSSGTSHLPHEYRNDGLYDICVTASDSEGATAGANWPVCVYNVSPCIVTPGPCASATVAEGYAYTLQLEATDPGPDDVITWTINWGDGTAPKVDTGRSLQLHHVFNARQGETLCVTVAASDGSSCASVCASVNIYIGASIPNHYRLTLLDPGPWLSGLGNTGELRLKGRHDADADNISDDFVYLTSPYAAPTTVRSMIEGYTCIVPGGLWGSSNYYYTFPNDTVYKIDYNGGTYDPIAQKTTYTGSISLWVAGQQQWKEKVWPFRLDPVHAPADPPRNVVGYATANTMLLTWAGAVPPQGRYDVEHFTNGAWTAMATVTGSATSRFVSAYTPGTPYRVRVIDGAGRPSAWADASVVPVDRIITGTPNGEGFTVRLRAGDPATMQVVVGATTTEFPAGQSLVIDTGLGNDGVIIDYANGNPFASGGGVRVFNSGGTDTLVAQNASAASATAGFTLLGGAFVTSTNLGSGRPMHLEVRENATLTLNTTQNLERLTVAGTVVGTAITAKEYELTAGSLTTSQTFIGGGGSFTQSGGVHHVLTGWTLSENYALSGGRLQVGNLGVTQNLTMNHAGQAEFVQTGGTVEVNGSLILASAAGTQARYELLGGGLTAAGSITIGSAGAATFAQGLATLSGRGTPPATVNVTVGAAGVFDYADASYQQIALTQQPGGIYRHIPAPALPATFTATLVSGDQIALAWEDVPGNHVGGTDYTRYRIERTTDGGQNWAALAELSGSATGHVVPGPFAAGEQFRLSAFDRFGRATEAIVPAPTNVRAVAVSAEEALIAWDAPLGAVDGFSIWVSTDGGEYEEFDFVHGSQTSYRFFSVASGTFRFRVSWRVGFGWHPSPQSPALDPGTNEETVISVVGSIVAPPTNVAVTGTAYIDDVSFSWAPSYSATGYIIQWSDDNYDWFSIDEGSATSYTDRYPALGVQYYRVVAYRGNLDPVYSEPSASLTVHPIAPPVAWYDDNGGANDRGTLSSFATKHSTPLTFSVLPNDIDYDYDYVGPMVTIAGYGAPANGSLAFDAQSQMFTYTPNAGFVGTDTFTYVVNDGWANSAPATVAIDVTNDIPRPAGLRALYEPDWYSFRAGVDGIPFVIGGQLSASDSDGDVLDFQITQGPANGSVSLVRTSNQSAQFVYTPGGTFEGTDFFKWRASDIEDGPEAVVCISLPLQMAFRNELAGLVTNRDTDVSWPGNVAGGIAGSWGGSVIVEQNVSHGTLELEANGQFIYTPPRNFKGIDTAKFRVAFGNIQTKTQTIHFDMREEEQRDPPQWPVCFGTYFQVPNTYAMTFSAELTQFAQPGNVTLSLGQPATRGQVNFNSDGSFQYVPPTVPQGEEPYHGWDFFSFIAQDGDLTWEQWVHLQVGDYEPLPQITVVSLPLRIASTPGEIAPTVQALESGFETAKNMLHALLTQLSQLGQGVGQVRDASDLDIINSLDAATTNIDLIADRYDEYVTQLVKLNKAAGKFLAAQWYVSQRDYNAVENVNKLPFRVGSLSASNKQMKQLADSLAALGEGAAVAVDTTNKVVRSAEVSHKVLTAVEMAGGVTALVKTGATLLVKEGLKACAKQAARELMQEVASGVAAEMANYAAELAGIDPQYRQYIAIGVDAYQTFAFLKAARVKMNPDGACFAAGTSVIVGINPDGSLVTRKIEEIQVGDFVLARDQHDERDGLDSRRVARVFRKTSDHLRILTIEGDDGNIEVLRTTDEHPFYVLGRGWVRAGELRVGDLVQEPDGTWQAVLASERQAFAGGVTVYNLEVEGDHTYFVEDGFGAADAVWVHNACDENGNWIGILYKKPLSFPGVKAKNERFTVRTEATYRPLRDDFDANLVGGPKDTFLKNLGNRAATDSAVKQKLRDAGLRDDQITKMASGEQPEGFQVHHKTPLKLGGTNAEENLMLIQVKGGGRNGVNYHAPVTTAGNRLTTAHSPGEPFDAEWPEFTGFIYP